METTRLSERALVRTDPLPRQRPMWMEHRGCYHVHVSKFCGFLGTYNKIKETADNMAFNRKTFHKALRCLFHQLNAHDLTAEMAEDLFHIRQ